MYKEIKNYHINVKSAVIINKLTRYLVVKEVCSKLYNASTVYKLKSQKKYICKEEERSNLLNTLKNTNIVTNNMCTLTNKI